jgi:hypothetical protein
VALTSARSFSATTTPGSGYRCPPLREMSTATAEAFHHQASANQSMEGNDVINLDRTAATTSAPIDSLTKTALVARVIYLITFVSIPTFRSTDQCGTIRTPS